MRITSAVFTRLLISTGLGVIIAMLGAIGGYLLIQAAALFGWPVILAGSGLTILLLFVIDTITSVFSPEQ